MQHHVRVGQDSRSDPLPCGATPGLQQVQTPRPESPSWMRMDIRDRPHGPYAPNVTVFTIAKVHRLLRNDEGRMYQAGCTNMNRHYDCPTSKKRDNWSRWRVAASPPPVTSREARLLPPTRRAVRGHWSAPTVACGRDAAAPRTRLQILDAPSFVDRDAGALGHIAVQASGPAGPSHRIVASPFEDTCRDCTPNVRVGCGAIAGAGPTAALASDRSARE